MRAVSEEAVEEATRRRRTKQRRLKPIEDIAMAEIEARGRRRMRPRAIGNSLSNGNLDKAQAPLPDATEDGPLPADVSGTPLRLPSWALTKKPSVEAGHLRRRNG